MGYFRDLKRQITGAVAQARDIRVGMTRVSTAEPTVVALDPDRQAEIDAQWPNGRGLAVVIRSRHDMDDGNRSSRTRVHLLLRLRLPGGGVGPSSDISTWTRWQVAVLLEPGLDVPVRIDPQHGSIESVDVDLLTELLRPRFDDAERRHPGVDLETGVEGVTGLPGALRDAWRTPSVMPAGVDADDPLRSPIDGMSWTRFVELAAIDPRGPTGPEAAPFSAWMQRMMTNPPLAQQFGVDLEDERRRRR
jgi:hypothetical protein